MYDQSNPMYNDKLEERRLTDEIRRRSLAVFDLYLAPHSDVKKIRGILKRDYKAKILFEDAEDPYLAVMLQEEEGRRFVHRYFNERTDCLEKIVKVVMPSRVQAASNI